MQVKQLPPQFIAKLATFVPQKNLSSLIDSFDHSKKIALRINTLSDKKAEVLKELQLLFPLEPVPWYSDAFTTSATTRELTALSIYKEGGFYIQGLSSMIPALALAPEKGERILDIAAAPGSKTTQLACLLANTGEIIANDLSRTRLFKLKANLSQQKVTNTTLTNSPGEKIWRRYPEYFDKVLIDAPCSMEGRFLTSDSDTFKNWSPRKVKELSHRQKFLVRSAVSCTKVGGTIIYSTCTLSPEENEEVVNWLLEKDGDSVSIEKISIPQLHLDPGILTFAKKNFSEDIIKTARIYPSRDMEGFFIAKIKKHRSTLTPALAEQLLPQRQ